MPQNLPTTACTALFAVQANSWECFYYFNTNWGQLPPSLVRNINWLGNFYLRVGQSSCSCFVSLIISIFSFHLSLAPCIKTHTKMQEMALKRHYFSKFSWGACPRTPLKVLTPLAQVRQIRVRPPQFLSPYAYANCSLYFKNTSSHTEKKE